LLFYLIAKIEIFVSTSFLVSEIQKCGLYVNVTNVPRMARERVVEMIEVSMEVSAGGVPLRLSVRAGSISRAMDLVAARYPRCDVRVVFPIRPEAFFSGEFGSSVERIALESPEAA